MERDSYKTGIMEAFKGKYERTAAENYDEMLKVIQNRQIQLLTLRHCIAFL